MLILSVYSLIEFHSKNPILKHKTTSCLNKRPSINSREFFEPQYQVIHKLLRKSIKKPLSWNLNIVINNSMLVSIPNVFVIKNNLTKTKYINSWSYPMRYLYLILRFGNNICINTQIHGIISKWTVNIKWSCKKDYFIGIQRLFKSIIWQVSSLLCEIESVSVFLSKIHKLGNIDLH